MDKQTPYSSLTEITTNESFNGLYAQLEGTEHPYILRPMLGYTPHIGAMLSMMDLNRQWLIESVEKLSVAQLDFQFDDQSNSIGAMLLHLAATERGFQITSFKLYENNEENLNKEWAEKWEVVRKLGKQARQVQGNSIEFYLDTLADIRKVTLDGFAQKDDQWFMAPMHSPDGRTNNYYWQWFHLCQHESYHRAQINLVKQRLPTE